MLFRRRSYISGEFHEMEIPITQEEWNEFQHNEIMIQDAFPQLSPSQREFLKTGATKEEWDEFFKDDYHG